MRSSFLFGLCILTLVTTLDAGSEELRLFISPGIKLAYAIGEPSGFTFGWELSIYKTGAWDPKGAEEGYVGLALDIDWCKSTTKYHIGFEGSQRMVGACIGPSAIVRDGKTYFGVTGTVYSWFVFLPYYSYTYVHEASDIHELGGYIKIPIQLTGHSIFDFRVGG